MDGKKVLKPTEIYTCAHTKLRCRLAILFCWFTVFFSHGAAWGAQCDLVPGTDYCNKGNYASVYHWGSCTSCSKDPDPAYIFKDANGNPEKWGLIYNGYSYLTTYIPLKYRYCPGIGSKTNKKDICETSFVVGVYDCREKNIEAVGVHYIA